MGKVSDAPSTSDVRAIIRFLHLEGVPGIKLLYLLIYHAFRHYITLSEHITQPTMNIVAWYSFQV